MKPRAAAFVLVGLCACPTAPGSTAGQASGSSSTGTSSGSSSGTPASSSGSTGFDGSAGTSEGFGTDTNDAVSADASETAAPGSTGDDDTAGALPEGPQVAVSFGERATADRTGTTGDTFISRTARDLNWGAHLDLHVTALDGEPGEVALLRFDVSSLPPGTPIVQAELHLVVIGTDVSGLVELFAIRESWLAGSSDAAPGIANWVQRNEFSWLSEGLQGESVDASPLGAFEVDAATSDVIVELPVDVVSSWVDDASENHGFALMTSRAATYLRSSNTEVPDTEPLLRITYVDTRSG